MLHPLRHAALAAALSPTLLAQITPAPCFESNLGTNLALGDDQVSQGNALGFSFTGPGGGAVTAIDISSNGFVWLGSNASAACCNGDLTAFLTDMPRIAPLWMDLYPPGGNGVYFNTFPATTTSLARAVVTWYQIPEYATTNPLTVQLQLLEDGSFTFTYDTSVANTNHTAIVGCTEGVTAVGNAVDISGINSSNPYFSGTNPTIHEEFLQTFDLAGGSYEFIPNGTNGYIVLDRPSCVVYAARVSTFGLGCPKPVVAYELFGATNQIDLSNTAIDFVGGPTTGYVAVPTTGFFTPVSGPITSGDDVVSGPFTLPFTFAFPGGSTNQIDISSNGFVWLSTGNFNSRCCFGNPAAFCFDPASLAVLWQDLNPSQGGTVHFDVDPNNTEVHITWLNVPEYFNQGSNTAQITLRSDSSFRLSYGAVANISHDCLVGFSQGNGAPDPGSFDFSAALPFQIGAGGLPLALANQTGSLPIYGTNFVLETTSFPTNSVFGVMAFGFQQFLPGTDLGAFGMPDCEQNVSVDAARFFVVTNNPAPFTFPIPNNTAFGGVTINAQSVTLSPGANAAGAITSNGVQFTIGQ